MKSGCVAAFVATTAVIALSGFNSAAQESPLKCGSTRAGLGQIFCDVIADTARVTNVILNHGACVSQLPTPEELQMITNFLAQFPAQKREEYESNRFLSLNLGAVLSKALNKWMSDPRRRIYKSGDRFTLMIGLCPLSEFTIEVNGQTRTWKTG
jgi:hypothetical protein